MTSGALFSPDRRYRYRLWRRWDVSRPVVAFCLLNPSTAGARRDDPTIRRCVGFARRWGYGGVEVVNLYAYRATDPGRLRDAPDAVGPDNDRHVVRAARGAELVVAAWGTRADASRAERALALLRGEGRPLAHLGLTRSRQPRHPLYLRGGVRPRRYGRV